MLALTLDCGKISLGLKDVVCVLALSLACACTQASTDSSGASTRAQDAESVLMPPARQSLPTRASTGAQDAESALSIDVVSSGSYGPEMLELKVKITNISGKHIKSAQATCVVKDGAGKEIAFQKHYVVKSTEGGLEAGRATYFTYIVDVSVSRAKLFAFQVDNVNW